MSLVGTRPPTVDEWEKYELHHRSRMSTKPGIKSMRTIRLREVIVKLNQMLVGYYHYYGITDNTRSLTDFRYCVLKSLYYWFNRRSEKKSYNWVEYLEMLDEFQLARPKIYVNIYA